MSADLVNETYAVNINGGVVEHRYTRTYQTTEYTNIITALGDADIPQLGHELITEGVIVYLVRKSPRRGDDKNGRKQIFVECEYTNQTQTHERDQNGRPITNLENAAPFVQVQWNEFTAKTYRGTFLGIAADDGSSLPLSEYPPYLRNEIGKERMITNSANLAPLNAPDKKYVAKQVTYWTYHRDWSATWETYIGDVTSEAFTVTQRDQDGIRLQYTFPAFSMVLQDIIKEDNWRGSKLWFRRGLVMSQDLSSYITEVPDADVAQAVWYHAWDPKQWKEVNGNDPRLAQFPDVTAIDAYIQENIVDANGAPLTSPVPLNGQGMPMPAKRFNGVTHSQSTKTYHLEYRCFDTSAWPTALGVS